MNIGKKENSKVYLLVLLGMLTAFGPFVTDMYLPSLPSMAGYFSASSSMVQLGLTTSLMGLAIGQIFLGILLGIGRLRFKESLPAEKRSVAKVAVC